jgi:DNA-binding NarL/FixJ family response regulator
MSSVSPVQVLVVEDFEPFRRFIRSVLEKLGNFRIVCEVSDGLEAIKKAGELNPELILLDLGLPRLNGMAAARQIRRLAPESMIIFMSLESSPDVVREAFRIGGFGYVSKLAAGRDLIAAIEAVVQNTRFVSNGLCGQNLAEPGNDFASLLLSVSR